MNEKQTCALPAEDKEVFIGMLLSQIFYKKEEQSCLSLYRFALCFRHLGPCSMPTSSSASVGRWPKSGWRPTGIRSWPKPTFLNVIWRAAWRVSFHPRYLFYTDVMLSCSNKKLCVQVVVTVWVTDTNKICHVVTVKGGKVCSDVK